MLSKNNILSTAVGTKLTIFEIQQFFRRNMSADYDFRTYRMMTCFKPHKIVAQVYMKYGR